MNISRLLKPVAHSCAATLFALATVPTVSVAAAIPLQEFFRLPAATSPKLSPSGQKLALLIPADNGRIALAVADISNPTRFVGIARFDDADVGRFGWINDGRLWFDATDHQSALGDQVAEGLFAVNIDGAGFAKLIDRKYELRGGAIDGRVLQGNRNRFIKVAGDGSDDVIIQRYEWVSAEAPADSKLLRLNTKTKEARNITPLNAPSGVRNWILDQAGEPRVAVASDHRTGNTIYWRDPANGAWVKLSSFDTMAPAPSRYSPVAVDFDGQLYVTAIDPATAAEAKTSALFRMSPKAGKLPEQPVLTLKGFDFDGDVLFDAPSRKTTGVAYKSDARGAVWFDPALRADQEAVDKQLDGTVNTLSCSPCSTARHLVVTAYSDRQSPVYFLYERATRKLQLIASSRPWLDSGKMAEQDFVRIKARDGLEFPAVVTRPQGKGPWPTVVLVHGGPFIRGEEWGFAPDSQFLASRGYLVIQPEYRGSQGYGDTLFKAGWRQWGLGMQDDVTDATRWAIAQGLADPKRVAIAGASYGGYATMMGLAKEPALYRAGINWVGVTDIGLMYEVGWSDFMGDKWMRYGMPKMIGDPDKDAAQLASTSPLQQAARIKQPVLMAYGEEDYRVPLPHGTKMRDALKNSGNNQVEWVVYEGEGHGWMLMKNTVDFWTRVEKFLANNLK
jgi:dipeptidyl aminopeptidase/acylaminoacyl peptidase